MCKSWNDQKEEGRTEGRAEGRAEAKTESILSAINMLVNMKITKDEIKLIENFSVSSEQAQLYYEEYEKKLMFKVSW